MTLSTSDNAKYKILEKRQSMSKINDHLYIKSDYFFKYLIVESVKNNDFLVPTIIEALTPIKVSCLELSNIELPPLGIDGKLNRVDIHVIDDQGFHYDIEMENGRLDENNVARFEIYMGKLLGVQESAGKPYDLINPVYEIIFISDTNSDELIERYSLFSDSHHERLKFDRFNFIVINMPLINEKSREELSAFEKIIYVFQNDNSSVILEVEQWKEVKLIMDTYNKFKYSEWYTAAEKDAQERAILEYKVRKKVEHEIRQEVEQEVKQEYESRFKELLEQKEEALEQKDKVVEENEELKAENTELKALISAGTNNDL